MSKDREKDVYPVLPGMPPVPGMYGSPIAAGNQFGKMNDEQEHATNSMSDEDVMEIRQRSAYSEYGKAAPDNNMFFEKRSNPLSSKGN